MNPSSPKPSQGEPSPRTIALDVMIRASLERLVQTPTRGGAAPSEALLFLGNWHDALPRLLIQDPVLEPVDKIVWQVVKLQAQAQTATSFPSYGQIARHANVASDATIARAIAILRATRWLTLCARARDQRGRFRGSIYALHDEPLPLADTLYLDQDYMQFLLNTAELHSHNRAKQVAQAVIESLQGGIEQGDDVLAIPSLHAQRLSQQGAVASGAMPGRQITQGMAIDARWVASLNRARLPSAAGSSADAQLQKMKLDTTPHRVTQPEPSTVAPPSKSEGGPKIVAPQNLKQEPSPPCSSCSSGGVEEIKSTTTTTTADAESATAAVSGLLKSLRFPMRLNDNDRRIAAMHLRKTPEYLRQPVLDLLDRKLKAENEGGEKLLFPTAYLAKLCQRAQNNTLVLENSLPTQSKTEQRAENEHHKQLRELKTQPQAAQGDIQHWTRMQQRYVRSRPDDPFPAKSLSDAQQRHTQILGQIKLLAERWTAPMRSG